MKQSSVLTKDIEKVDVTKEIKQKCINKKNGYEKALGKIDKLGSLYIIEFAEGYTAFGEKTRKARRLAEIQWYSRIATEEKNTGKTIKDYITEFKENGIVFDGKTIPEFIDTVEEVKVQETKEVIENEK